MLLVYRAAVLTRLLHAWASVWVYLLENLNLCVLLLSPCGLRLAASLREVLL